jgi:hypothetical protein
MNILTHISTEVFYKPPGKSKLGHPIIRRKYQFWPRRADNSLYEAHDDDCVFKRRHYNLLMEANKTECLWIIAFCDVDLKPILSRTNYIVVV